MPTFVYGDFEWDEAKAMAIDAKPVVRFEEAAQAFTDPYSVDLADAVQPDRLVTLAMSPHERILYVVTTELALAPASSARVAPAPMNDESTKPTPEPTDESLAEMPEITDEQRFRRIPGRGHHANLRPVISSASSRTSWRTSATRRP